MKRNTLLIFPPFQEHLYGSGWKESEATTAPLGLMYLATPLTKAGYPVKFMDLTVDRMEEDQYFRELTSSHFILISCYTHTLKNVKKIIQDVRKVNKHAVIICGGPYCTETQNHIEGADVCVFGEADLEIVNIVDSLLTNRFLDNIPGLSFWRNGKLVRTEGKLLIENLDLIEPPSMELAKDKNYGYIYGEKVGGIYALMSSRGCPFSCTFCSYQKKKYRERSVDNVIQEIKMREEEGARYIIFYDDNFLMRRERVIEIMDKIIENKIDLKFAIQGRVDIADLELYRKLKQAGVVIMLYGIESANQDVLDYYNKKTTVEKARRAITLADQVGIITFGNMILGAPIEERRHFEINKKFLKEVPLDLLSIHILHYIYPLRIWTEAYEKGLIGRDEIVVAADERLSHFSYEELRKMEDELVRSFYNSPQRVLRIARKFRKNLGIKFIMTLLRLYLSRKIYRTAEKFHGVGLKNIRE